MSSTARASPWVGAKGHAVMSSPERYSRGALIRRSAAVAAGLALLGPAEAIAGRGKPKRPRRPRRLPIYGLDPNRDPSCSHEDRARHRCSCNACKAHARNRIFPTKKAADGNRAHVGCNCGVVRRGTLPYAVWVALFGSPRKIHRYSVDIRTLRRRRRRRRRRSAPLPRSVVRAFRRKHSRIS
jgi:hypothetical protein